MAKKFQELRASMSPAARAASEAEHRRLIEEMSPGWNDVRICMSARSQAICKQWAQTWRFERFFPTAAL